MSISSTNIKTAAASSKQARQSQLISQAARACIQPLESRTLFAASVIDGSFSGGTPVVTGFVAEATAPTSDGKLLVVGRQGDLNAGASQYVLKKLNADGSVDSSFGKSGVLVSALGDNSAGFAVTIADDGSIFVAGSTGTDLAVWKFKSSGSLDKGFGEKGSAVVDLGTAIDRAYGVALGTDGSIFAVGSAGADYSVVKLTSGGSVDGTFGTGGKLIGSTVATSVLSSVAVAPDGKIVAGGSIGEKVAVYRFLPTGAPDNSFAGNALLAVPALEARTDIAGGDHTVGVAVEGDKILVANKIGGDYAISRLLTNGDFDTSFANGGILKLDFGGDDDADQVIVQSTGQIFVIGTTVETGQNPRLGVAVLLDDGSLDTTFGEGGKTTVDAGITSTARALHIGDLVVRAFGSAQKNGQLVVGAGTSTTTTTVPNTGLRRLNVPGSGLLGSFGTVNGKNRKLPFVETADGTRVTLSLKGGGTAKALYDGTQVDITVTGSTDKSSLTISSKGGDGKVTIRNLTIDGALKSLSAKSAVITGSFTVGGKLAKAEIATFTGTLAAAGGIGSLSVRGDVTNAYILAGASLGSDGKVSGTTGGDIFSAGSIQSLKISGAVRGSVIGAGVSSADAVIPSTDDTVVTPAASIIDSLSVKGGVDANSKVIAGGVKKAKIPGAVDVLSDSRFKIISA